MPRRSDAQLNRSSESRFENTQWFVRDCLPSPRAEVAQVAEQWSEGPLSNGFGGGFNDLAIDTNYDQANRQ